MNYNKELLNRFLTEKVVVAVRTQDEWNEFMKLLESETDLRWLKEKKPTECNYWKDYKEETAINNSSNQGGLEYCYVDFYKIRGYEIIEFKELVKEREMNLADKLRFLADRWEDGQGFYIMYSENKIHTYYKEFTEDYDIQELEVIALSLEPQWEFTEDEKVILRNLPERFKWIARYKGGDLCLYSGKPIKTINYWKSSASYYGFNAYKHLFQSIKWYDEEPCEFRKYI